MFKVKLYESDKQSFEDLFTKVMSAKYKEFKQVKPQGRYGDGKCDGFRATDGAFYQVYAPENLSGNENTANKKLDDSVKGIIEYWSKSGFEIETCHFVVNDKFQNLYATAHTNAQEVGKKHNVKCELMTCSSLLDTFLTLEEQEIIDIIGFIPDPLSITTIDYSVLHEVVGHLLSSSAIKIKEAIPKDPDFEHKITFNNLSTAVASILNAGQIQHHVIKDYFDGNAKFDKEELRLIFNSLYEQGKTVIQDGPTKSDEIFQYIAEKSSPRDNFVYYSAIYVLMAYYFEFCDIFETPTP